MKKENAYSLIEGTFTASEGKDILRNVFTSKIQFHRMKNFSSQERFGTDDAVAARRIPQLSESLNEILRLISEAETNGEQLEIRSQVVIRKVEKHV